MRFRRRQLLAGSGFMLLGGCISFEPPGGGSQGDGDDTETPTLTPADPPTATDSPTPTATDSPTPTATESPTPEPTETVDYSQTYSETTSIEGGNGFPVKIQFAESFILQWAVENELSTDLDFDVFLFTESEYDEYVQVLRGESGNPDYITGGTVQGIETGARATVTLEGGTYVLVVDNSDIGDAGDFGEESTRRVTIELSTQKA